MNRTTGMILFALTAMLIVALIHFYFWARLVRDTGLQAPWRQIGTAAIVLLALSIPFAMIVGREAPFDLSRPLAFAPFVWMGVMLLLLFFLGVTDLGRLVTFLVKKAASAGDTADPGRRVFMGRLIAGGAAVAAGGLATVATVKGAARAKVISQKVRLAKLPEVAEGLRLVQISDLHVGVTEGRDWLAEVVSRVNALEADAIVVTGDLVDGTRDKLEAEVAPLADLKARLGVFAVTGNHEYYSGVTEWIPEFERLGMRVLRNESVELTDGLLLAGIDDHNSAGMAPGHGPDLERALASRTEDQEVVLLAHQPRAVFEAAKNDVGLLLAGHTHGGQIWPFTMLVGLQQPYNKGLHMHNERTAVYVNQGTGTWGPPMRLGSFCEITEITLSRA